MEPILFPGDRVLVWRITPENVRFGDIVLFKGRRNLIVHRIISVKRNSGEIYFAEKGEREYKGRFLSPDAVIGKVIRVKRRQIMLNPDSKPGQWANLITSFWIFAVCGLISLLKGSRYKIMNKAGGALWRLYLFSSRGFSGLCYLVWFMNRTSDNREEICVESIGH